MRNIFYSQIKQLKKGFLILLVFLFIMNGISLKGFGAIGLSGGSIATAVTTNTTTSTTLTISKPSGLAVGDIMIAQIVQSGNNGGVNSIGDAYSTDASWTEVAGSNIRSDWSNYCRATLLYKIVTFSDVSATNFSFTLDGNSDDGEGGIVAFTGVNIGSPFDVTPGNAYTNISNDQTLTATSIITVTANSVVIMFGALFNNYNIGTFTTGTPGNLTLTDLYDVPFDATIDIGMGAAYATKSSAGGTGTGNANISSSSNNVNNGSILIALKPCSTPTSPTSVTATPSTICTGSSCELNATSAGNIIQWYTTSTGGTSLGSSASGVNFSVAPTATTTYYAESFNGGDCVSTSRTAVTVTVNASAPTITCPSSQTINAATGTCAATATFSLPTVGSSCVTYPPSGFGTPQFNSANGKYYALSSATATWANADLACRNAGGHLATVSNAAENSFLTTISGGNTVWIGYTDQSEEGNFRWVTGENVVYTNWNSGEPNNSSNEDYTELNTSGGWNDNSSTLANRYIIEFEVSLVQTAGLSSGSNFPVGVTTNTFTATNASGISSSCSFNVTVTENVAPVITRLGNASVEICQNQTYTDAGATATDNCDGSITPSVDNPVNTAVPGNYTVTYTATDASGNPATPVTRSVKVNALPSVTCPADFAVYADAAAFTLTGGLPAGGTYSGTGVSGGQFDPATAGVGVHTITYTYTDGNTCSNSCTFTLTVRALPTFTTSDAVNVSCFGGTDGSIQVNITGGTDNSPYTFSISNGNSGYTQSFTGSYPAFTLGGLSAGTLKIRIKDKYGCASASCD